MRWKLLIVLILFAGLFVFFMYSLLQLKHELETNKKMNEEEKSRYEEIVKDLDDSQDIKKKNEQGKG